MWRIIRNEKKALKRNKAILGISLGFLIALFLSVFLGNLQTNEQTGQYIAAKNKLRTQWAKKRNQRKRQGN